MTDSSRKPNRLAQSLRIALSILLVLVALAIAVYYWRINQKYTVARGVQDNDLGTIYGYKVENYAFTYGMRITVWEKEGLLGHITMQSIYDLPELTVDKVDKNEWIKSNGALYLKLQIIYHDSVRSTRPASIIYDFHTGEIHITSEFTLWRMWSEELSFDDWMTENEFDNILTELKQ